MPRPPRSAGYQWRPGKFSRVWDQLIWDRDGRLDGTLDLYCVMDRLAGPRRLLTGETARTLGAATDRSHQWVGARLRWLIARGYVEVADDPASRRPATYRLTDHGGLGIIPDWDASGGRLEDHQTPSGGRLEDHQTGSVVR